MSSALPQFIIIGAPRSGTTWLHHQLVAHPGIFMPPVEPHFFDRHYDQGMSWYRDQFSTAPAGCLIGEKTPAYLFHPQAAERIRSHLPDARLIAILREPVSRSISHYRNLLAKDPSLTRRSFEETLDAVPTIREASNYSHGLHRYFDLFPREQLRIFLYDELRAEPERLVAETCRFLGVEEPAPQSDPAQGKRVNASAPKFVRSPALARVARSLERRGLGRLSGWVDRFNRKPLPPVPEPARERLAAAFAGEIRDLEALIGRDLSGWLETRAPAHETADAASTAHQAAPREGS